jgi:hypothetical protein
MIKWFLKNMKNMKKLKKAFGINEFAMIDFPKKISNIKVSRLLNGELMGCSLCFPHGIETINSTDRNKEKNWKSLREYKWKQH